MKLKRRIIIINKYYYLLEMLEEWINVRKRA